MVGDWHYSSNAMKLKKQILSLHLARYFCLSMTVFVTYIGIKEILCETNFNTTTCALCCISAFPVFQVNAIHIGGILYRNHPLCITSARLSPISLKTNELSYEGSIYVRPASNTTS